MEEKKPVNVRLSTAVLSIIIAILIAGIGYFVYQNIVLKNKQSDSERELRELQSKTTQELQDLQNKTQELQNTIYETERASNTTQSNESSDKSSVNMTESQAKKIVEEKVKLAIKLIDLSDEFFKTKYDKVNNAYPVVNYQEICNKYMTSNFEKYFRNNIWGQSEWKNGTLYMLPSDYPDNEIEKIDFNNIKIYNNDIKTNLKMRLVSEENVETGRRNYNCDFEIIKESGEWKINK